MDDGVPRAARLDVSAEIQPWIVLPDHPLSTRVARAVLPERVPHADAAFNAGRAALMVHALTTQPTLLFEATEDRLHQAYRASVMEETIDLIEDLRAVGLAATVSGAGPAVLVLATAEAGRAIVPPKGWTVRRLDVAPHGGTVARLA
jgi:homoserine kinase